jgi:hypothetical protein
MKKLLFVMMLMATTGCGLVGFDNNLDNGVRNHNTELVGFKISNLQSDDDKVEITVKNRYRAKVNADSASNSLQENVSASNKVDVRIAVDKILATYLSAGASSVAEAVKIATLKRDNGVAITAKEGFAANLSDAKTAGEVEKALNDYLSKNHGDDLTVNLKTALEKSK